MAQSDTVAAVLDQKGRDVWSVLPNASVYQAIELMAGQHVGAVLVVAADGRLVGIVSERDYARKVILQGRNSKDTPVSDIMTTPVVCVGPRHTVSDCMQIMTNRRIRHLPVVEGEAVAGVVSISDLVKWMVAERGEMIQQLEAYITGKYPG